MAPRFSHRLFWILFLLSPHLCHGVVPSDANFTSLPVAEAPVLSGWLDESVALSTQGFELFKAINDARNYGLDPVAFYPKAAEQLLEQIRLNRFDTTRERDDALHRFNTLMHDAYITLAQAIYYGQSDFDQNRNEPNTANSYWDVPPKNELDLEKYLSIHFQQNRIFDSLSDLHPDYAEYSRLSKALQQYRAIASNGGWPLVPSGDTIRIGSNDPRLSILKQRLLITGDLHSITRPEHLNYDEPDVIDAVKSFQFRHDLDADGVIGAKTLLALNVPVQTRIKQILLNLERFRHLPAGLETHGYIDVNLPGFSLNVYEGGYKIMEMKTIVGTKERPTPLLYSRLAYAVANPTWTVPDTIVKEDMFKAGQTLSHIERYRMRVYAHTKTGLSEINPYAVKWSRYAGKERIPFTFKADAGEANPLGKVKFIFPNRHDVYLHDTNAPALFEHNRRSFSSGCVRISAPIDLLRYLSETPEEESDPTVNRESDTIINLKKRIPVLFRYMTVSVNDEQKIFFYDDIYGYDFMFGRE